MNIRIIKQSITRTLTQYSPQQTILTVIYTSLGFVCIKITIVPVGKINKKSLRRSLFLVWFQATYPETALIINSSAVIFC